MTQDRTSPGCYPLQLRVAAPAAMALFVAVAALLCCGCQHTYQEVSVPSAPTRPVLRTDSTVYVALPPDGRFRREFVFTSGEVTAVAIRDAFAKYVRRAYVGRRVQNFAEGLQTARSNQWMYFVYPSVLRWEDHTTDLSGRRDKIEIKIEVTDAASGELLHATVLRGRSRLFSDWGDNPRDLLAEPIQNYVASLFQPIRVPSALR